MYYKNARASEEEKEEEEVVVVMVEDFLAAKIELVVSMEEEEVCPVSPHDYPGQNTMQMG
jgi:uncharacterized OsmC-like protein